MFFVSTFFRSEVHKIYPAIEEHLILESHQTSCGELEETFLALLPNSVRCAYTGSCL